MKTKELEYLLPAELIAQHPVQNRSKSRLLVLDRKTCSLTDSTFENIGGFLVPGDCLVLNDTKVLPARFYGQRSTGGKIEGLFLNKIEPGAWQVFLKGGQKLKRGEQISLNSKNSSDKAIAATVLKKQDGGLFLLTIEDERDYRKILQKIGFPPLPPYIKRDRDLHQAEKDRYSYQTVYARSPGAIAAPTAGLHFTKQLIKKLKLQKIQFARITLHVGVGTFAPVKTENLEDHKIHAEYFSIDQKNANLINRAKKNDKRIIAVGTTSVRTLESVAEDSQISPRSGTTDLFIMPGYKFKMIDGMITNFHLPRSTLLALVAAFAGLDKIKTAYAHAVKNQYRFYSYGDAMLIL